MAELQVGAARSNITPPLNCQIAGFFNVRTATDIADELQAKTVVFATDDTQLGFCMLDLILTTREQLAAAKQRAHELTGIPVENLFIACTHTHFGPAPVEIFNVQGEDEYMEWALARVGDSFKLAYNRLQPAEVGFGAGLCPEETHNRRWVMRDGSVMMNPGYENPEMVRPAGPIDPEVGLLVARNLDGQPLAAIGNYPLHYVGGPYSLSISADYFGYFDRALQRLAGAEFTALMANGFCGDINNCDFTRPAPTYPHPFAEARRVGNRVAAVAYGAWQGIRQWDRSPALGAVTLETPFIRRTSTEDELAAARAYRERVNDPTDADWMYAGELLALQAEPVERLTPVMAGRIGGLGIVGLPGEIFVEYGLQIKKQSPFAQTFTVELANDYIGYCPTDKALAEGSYETRLARTAKAAAGTEGRFVTAAVQALQAVYETTEK